MSRITSIDLVRGLVMIIMALDHVRDFTHAPAIAWEDPLDLASTTPWLYLTRFITHFCAPVFVLLSGTSMFLSMQSRGTGWSQRRFILQRGIVLVLAECTLITFGWFFDVTFSTIVLQVIWAIGVSMIVLSLTSAWGPRVNMIIGLVIMLTHNAFDGIIFTNIDAGTVVWHLAHQGFGYTMPWGAYVIVVYPVIPWIGIMMIGYGLGTLYTQERDASWRSVMLVRIGLIATLGFVVLRAVNLYGDPVPWSMQTSWWLNVASFLKCQKYPPSLCYALMTLGPALMVLGLLERWRLPEIVHRVLMTFGRVPMFYYVMHIYLGHLLSWSMFLASGIPLSMFWNKGTFGGAPPGSGFDLWVVYVAWVVLIVLLYPLCRWYDAFKTRRKDLAVLRYF